MLKKKRNSLQFLPLSCMKLMRCYPHPATQAGQAVWTPRFVNMITQDERELGFSNAYYTCIY